MYVCSMCTYKTFLKIFTCVFMALYDSRTKPVYTLSSLKKKTSKKDKPKVIGQTSKRKVAEVFQF